MFDILQRLGETDKCTVCFSLILLGPQQMQTRLASDVTLAAIMRTDENFRGSDQNQSKNVNMFILIMTTAPLGQH